MSIAMNPTRFNIDYQIPIVEREQINGSHHTIPLDQDDPRFNEPMVDLKDYDIAFESYHAILDGLNPPYYKPIGGSRQQGLLRQTVAEKLVKVNQHLQPFGAELLILDAYRSIECQQGLWEFFYQRGRSELDNPSEEDCRQYALGYVRDPRIFDPLDTRTFPIHITGSSVDVTLKYLGRDQLLNMGSAFEEIIDVSYTDYFERMLLKGMIAKDDIRLLNRRLMDWAFTNEGFLNDPILYWHYDWGNQLWIKVKKALHDVAPEKAWYGHVESPDWSVPDASTLVDR
ncbi:MAG: hypothetical protein JKX81_14350 [Arenicella sp.]|nr:hypothetical protein [Arenicella sp.]